MSKQSSSDIKHDSRFETCIKTKIMSLKFISRVGTNDEERSLVNCANRRIIEENIILTNIFIN